MSTINGRACVVNGIPVDKVFSNGRQVYGRNIASGTSSDWQKASFPSDWGITYLCDPIYEIVEGETYTVQVEVRNMTSPIMLEIWYNDAGSNRIGIGSQTRPTISNDGIVSVTFTAHLPDDYAYLEPNLAFTSPITSPGSYEFCQCKIEKGSVATPWTPAPEDVGIK